MSGAHRNQPCPCGTGGKYKRCCLPLHNGGRPAGPEALMRSRYSAYALGCVDYIMETTHPDGPHFEQEAGAWRSDLTHYCRATQFDGLEVMESAESDDEGSVLFRASLSQGGEDLSFVEHSLFYKCEGRWLYHSAIDVDG